MGCKGNGFYGIPLSKYLPYTIQEHGTIIRNILDRHAWLASGLYIGPAVSGVEPKYQRLGVNVLFGALLVVVLGSMLGEWLSVMNKMSDSNCSYSVIVVMSILIRKIFPASPFIGLLLWLVLMVRAIKPALKKKVIKNKSSHYF